MHFIEKIIALLVFSLTVYVFTRQSAPFLFRVLFIRVLYLALSSISSAQAVWLQKVRKMDVRMMRVIGISLMLLLETVK